MIFSTDLKFQFDGYHKHHHLFNLSSVGQKKFLGIQFPIKKGSIFGKLYFSISPLILKNQQKEYGKRFFFL